MLIELKNEVVRLTSEDGVNFNIYRAGDKELEREVGFIHLTDSLTGVYVEIAEDWRGQHFASNAVYLFTQYAHDHLRTAEIRVVIGTQGGEMEMAKHILEHAGYEMASKSASSIEYVHHAVKTEDATSYCPPEGSKVLYLAGGCFWGTQRAFNALRGVVETKVGYANGHIENPTYEMICRNETGYRETVRVTYDPAILAIETLLKAYFIVTDPTHENQQGGDIGTQYQSGIYWKDPADEAAIMAFVDKEKENYDSFYVETKPLECFYTAEEYHQDYLVKNTDGYCHVTRIELEKIKELN